MNHIGHKKLGLKSRNEGKIKSYESCSDLRAWNHDVTIRDRYLKDWIKSDMPISIIPVSTLADFLRTMTCKNRGRATPRCHPNCKSKIVLESICTSCHAMKDCFKNEEKFEKYFEDEDFETCHWPCEKCLDALKSIKLFWKVIVDKIFNISFMKNEKTDVVSHYNRRDKVGDVAKAWQTEMVQQARYVRNLPSGDTHKTNESICTCKCSKRVRVEPRIKPDKSGYELSASVPNESFIKRLHKDPKPLSDIKENNKVNRSVSVMMKSVDTACETCDIKNENDECEVYKKNLNFVQERFNVQYNEVERLKKENTSLKIELQNVYNNCSIENAICCPAIKCAAIDENDAIPKPFESCVEDALEELPTKDMASEMIITMKNCKNPHFKHVSLLQVLHKTNDSFTDVVNPEGCRKEDPINVLRRMQHTFGSIVQREIDIVKKRSHSRTKISDIEASFHTVNSSRSAPSCSLFGTMSMVNFVYTRDSCEYRKVY